MTAREVSPLAQIRASAQALLAQGQVDDACALVLAALDSVLVKNRELELLVLKLRRDRLGRHTERLDPRQIRLLFDALVAQGVADHAIDPDAEAREDAANYLFSGSHDAARRAAALYSLVRTCAQHGVPPLPYLTDILTKLAAGWSVTRLDDLLPHQWAGSDVAGRPPAHA